MFSDLVVQVTAAEELIKQGRIPDRGSVASMLGRVPPGTAWLLAPGLLVAQDPRLFEVPSSVVLFLLTLVGIVLIGRAWLGETCGWTAAAIYAFSSVGVMFATSLWPRGHPVFVVWIVYFCYLAVERSQVQWLLLAVVSYVFGTYVFLEIAPAGILLLIAPLMKRSLFTWWLLPAAAIIAALVWWPYINLQQKVDFADVKSLVSLDPRIPGVPEWCSAEGDFQIISLQTGRPAELSEFDLRYPVPPKDLSGFRLFYAHTLPSIVRSFSWNYRTQNSKLELLRSAALSVLLVLGVAGCFGYRGQRFKMNGEAFIRLLAVILAGSVALLLGTLKILGILDARLEWTSADSLFLVVVSASACALAVASFLSSQDRRFRYDVESLSSRNISLLVSSGFIVGQLAWSIMTPAETRRFMWLWPLQCLIAAYALCDICRRLRWRPQFQILLCSLLVLSFAISAVLLPLRDWKGGHWGGEDIPQIKLLDRLASHYSRTSSEGGGRRLSVSYDVSTSPFMLAANTVDGRYTVGMAYDTYLRYRHSIHQDLTCADTYSEESQYLIREYPSNRSTFVRFQRTSDEVTPGIGEYVQLAQEGNFSLFWRPAATFTE